MSWIPRHLEPAVQNALENFPCVFINGPRQAGKTTLAQRIWPESRASHVTFDDTAALALASSSPDVFLSGWSGPLVLDEIQLVPPLFRSLKASIDSRRAQSGGHLAGLYILTGSTNILSLPRLSDALVGRMIVKTLYPFSAAEIHHSTGCFAERLKKGDFSAGPMAPQDAAGDLVETIRRATFPEIHDAGETARADWFRSYVSALVQRDVRQIMDIEKVTLLPQLLRLMATRTGGLLNEADLARSIRENAVTTRRYRTLLDLLFLTVTVPPWFRNAGKRLVRSPKVFLLDTSMVCHLTGRTLGDVARSDPGLFGHLLENFVATELLKQAAASLQQSGLHHFRTSDGKEVDFVIEFPDQTLVGIEVKAADTVSLGDCAGLVALQQVAGRDFAQGCILYRGRQRLKMTEKIWALPLSTLWASS